MKLTGYYTTAGEKIAAGLLAGATLSVSRIAAGSGSTALSADALDQEQQDLGPCTPEVSGTTAVLRCTLSSDQASAPYFLREIGVYALDGAGKEVLYLIFRLDEEVSIHPSFRLVLRFNLEQTLSDGAGVKITAPLTGLATQEDLKTKADLAGGQVPYAQIPHLTWSKIFYVDAAAGSDENAGTQQAPFRTIQAAVNALPKDLGTYPASITVLPGTYDEDVIISGFIGGRNMQPLRLIGSTEADTSTQIRSLTVCNCACTVEIQGFYFTGAINAGNNLMCAVNIAGAHVDLNKIYAKATGTAQYGVIVGGNGVSQAILRSSVLEGFQGAGAMVDFGSVANIASCTVKNCAVGVQAGSAGFGHGGLVYLYNMTYEQNSADTATKFGGQIFGG